MDKPQFTEMDLHCIARLIQTSFQAPEQKDIGNTYRPLYGCMYCKYAFECENMKNENNGKHNFDRVLRKLEELTGVYQSTAPSQLTSESIGRKFFPASAYIEHPEMLHELGKIHPQKMMDGFKTSLQKVINHSNGSFDQK